MSKFFVGQRVRVVKPLNPRLTPGLEATIIAIGQFDGKYPGGEIRPGECKLDIWRIKAPSGDWVATFDQLEPILPEGSAPSEFTFQQLMDNLQEVMA
ncbi:hypothetical protein JAK47_01780 [Stenotrophomonas maltophilia]|uniref:hypothetical protein n=1 Tax=Stenotrophomonas maltophilia TaxID=40324 RepID=UPI0021CADEC8|nr:hypothetical protein [Stenotrophomonas maltophilia]MCU1053275.1 hypothetical protein [Stenotrophomonas maltophilia]